MTTAAIAAVLGAILGCNDDGDRVEAGNLGAGGEGGAGAADAGGEGGAGAAAPDGPMGPSQLLIPLLPSYRNWDYHLFQGLDDHPRYEMVELMLDDTTSEEPLAWVFFTEREAPKRQLHYVSDAAYAADLARTASPDTRVVEVTPIDVSWQQGSDGAYAFEVALETGDGPVTWSVRSTGPATADYAELVEQSDHDLLGGILVMYLNQTVLVDAATALTIGDETWPVTVWEDISNAYFTGYHGAVSPRLANGYLASYDEALELVALPERLEPGEGWTYRVDDEERQWLITEREGDALVVAGGSYTLELDVEGDALRLRSVRVTDDGGELALRYDPALPDLGRLVAGGAGEVAVAIDIDGHADVVSGALTFEADGDGRVALLLAPEAPAWAVKNPMRLTLDVTDAGHAYSSRTTPATE